MVLLGAIALTTVKVADKGLDVVKAVNALDNITDAARLAENADDLVDGARALEKIEDGLSLPPVPEELGAVVKKIESPKPKHSPTVEKWKEKGHASSDYLERQKASYVCSYPSS